MQYRVFALADLHLPGADDKTMDIFGPLWENHPEVIRRHWINTVAPQDFVLCAGDISWAMNLAEVAGDLDWLGQLPGRIILSKGNHDYWWQSISQLRTALPLMSKLSKTTLSPCRETLPSAEQGDGFYRNHRTFPPRPTRRSTSGSSTGCSCP